MESNEYEKHLGVVSLFVSVHATDIDGFKHANESVDCHVAPQEMASSVTLRVSFGCF